MLFTWVWNLVLGSSVRSTSEAAMSVVPSSCVVFTGTSKCLKIGKFLMNAGRTKPGSRFLVELGHLEKLLLVAL